jgi:hypothetical protein
MTFTKKTLILYFNPRSSSRWSKRQDLLLPAFCYRVNAPKIQKRNVNILEKAVLGICRIGSFSAVEIGDNLDIGADLAALIITQFIDQGFIDKQGLLTKTGLKILEQETIENQEMVAGYIFQDPWTSELFPRFMERQEYIDVQFNQDGYPELNLGTTGKPNYRRFYLPSVTNIIQVTPSPQDILQAVIKHDKALRHRKFSEEVREDVDDDWTFKQVPDLKRISFIEAEPTPFWLATYIYLPKPEEEEDFSTGDWNICDPFGIGDSPWLRRKLEIQIRKNPDLKGVKKLISDIDEKSQTGENRVNEFIAYAEEEAIVKVENKLTIEIRRWDNIFEQLVAMEISYIEAECSKKSERKKDKLDDVLIKSQKVIETVLLLIRENYPTDKSWQKLSANDREYNRDLLNKLANQLGFITRLPNTLLDVKQGKIRSAADSGIGSLRSHLLAALLTARYQNQHPLNLLAKKSPDMLILLDKLAEMRDKSSHSSNQKLEMEEVSQQIDIVYEFVSGMLGINL